VIAEIAYRGLLIEVAREHPASRIKQSAFCHFGDHNS